MKRKTDSILCLTDGKQKKKKKNSLQTNFQGGGWSGVV